MKSEQNDRIPAWKRLAAIALCIALLLQPLSASAAARDVRHLPGRTDQAADLRYLPGRADQAADLKYAEEPAATLTVSLGKSTYAYTGKTIRPKVSVTQGGKEISSKNYTVTYGEMVKNKFKKKTPKAMGYYAVKVTFKKAYKKQGTKMLFFSITPKAPSLTGVKVVKNKTLKITWKKVPKASGYTIWLVPANYKGGYHTTVKKNVSSCSIALNKLTTGEYYVYVIAYAKQKGKQIAGAPSDHLTVTITGQGK